MVPAEFRTFFEVSAEVAGTLIGLLFVAVSVAPRWHEGDLRRRADSDVRAGVAFVALVNALVVSLYALIPGGDLATATLLASAASVVGCVGFAVLLVRVGPPAGRRHKLVLIGAQTFVFVSQLLTAAHLSGHPHSRRDVQTLATFTVVFFLVGIFRAWQLVGAREMGVIRSVAQGRQDRPARDGTRGRRNHTATSSAPRPVARSDADLGAFPRLLCVTKGGRRHSSPRRWPDE